MQSTLDFWRRWLSKSTYRGRWREEVHRSALVLKLMVYDPTGALVAAPTMGLPERIGGERNWDYRYTWLRDAAFTLYALISIGFDEEARNFMDYLRRRCECDWDGLLQPLYGIDGREDISETELDHLSGYMNSRPGKARQRRVRPGPARPLRGHPGRGVPLQQARRPSRSRPLEEPRRILGWLSDNWQRPGRGYLGGRGRQAAVRLLQGHELGRPRAGWAHLPPARASSGGRALDLRAGQDLRGDHGEGLEPGEESFVQYYGSDALDASLLLMPLTKFVGPTDPRWLSTLDRIQEELTYDTLVDRYKTSEAAPDGLQGRRGSFRLCSFWLVECLTQAGRLDEARLALEKMFSYANHLGLYAEEIGAGGEALGNFPQALTHLSLISAAVHLDRALGALDREPTALRGSPQLQRGARRGEDRSHRRRRPGRRGRPDPRPSLRPRPQPQRPYFRRRGDSRP